MSSSWPSNGLRASAEYQCSGIPFVTSSNSDECDTTTVTQIKFPFVARWVEINTWKSSATSSHLRVGFTSNGVSGKGAVTGSIPTGLTNDSGNQKWELVPASELVNTDAMLNNHANYYLVPASSGATTCGTHTVRLEFACTDLFLLADSGTTGFTLVAGLTGIARDQLALTGSRGFQGVG